MASGDSTRNWIMGMIVIIIVMNRLKWLSQLYNVLFAQFVTDFERSKNDFSAGK